MGKAAGFWWERNARMEAGPGSTSRQDKLVDASSWVMDEITDEYRIVLLEEFNSCMTKLSTVYLLLNFDKLIHEWKVLMVDQYVK